MGPRDSKAQHAAGIASASGASSDVSVLLDRLRAGDASAFDAVYEAYRPRVHSFLLRLTRDAALARDLAQDVWLRLAVNAPRLLPGTDVGAWLFTVARNLFVSQRRWALLDRQRLAELGLMAPRRELPSPVEAALASDLHARLERAIAALPVQQREVILLVAIERFEIAEVARMLDVRDDAVRQRLSRARAALTSAIGAEP